jgi:hypothetical protein
MHDPCAKDIRRQEERSPLHPEVLVVLRHYELCELLDMVHGTSCLPMELM